MNRKWHIRKRVFLTLIGLTCIILLAVALAFNLTMRSYIKSRVSEQLTTTSVKASEERRGDKPERSEDEDDKEDTEDDDDRKGGRMDDRPDRITGAQGNAILLDEDGSLLLVLHGDESIGEALAEYFRENGISENENEIVHIGEDSYAVSITDDPVKDTQHLLSFVDVTSLTALTNQINLMLLIVILAAIILSILLSRHFARSFAEPVQSLSSFAEEIGAGNLAPHEFRFRDVEFDTLADSMNHMANELQSAKQKQETFFQNVSHELRTPLTSIRGNAEGIVYGIIDPQTGGKIILSESDKLGGMVEDILYLSRMGRVAPEGTTELLDLREILSLCVSEQRAEAEKQGIGFRFAFDEHPVQLPIREQDAQRLFGNLISNAIRYAKSEVQLTCQKADHSVLISIADDGAGISPEDMPYIFERFYRGKDGRHGIGLAIAQSVTDTYHGTISVHNDSGAVFEVRFPDH